jgi:hypothetical protein
VPLVFGLFGRFRPPHALAARCGIVVRRRIHFPGRPFARSRSGERCQGFSPLQPRCRSFVRHDPACWRAQRLRTPCAHRLGERTKRQRLGRVIVAPRPDSIASWQSSLVHGARALHLSRTCLALTKAQDPTRLPRIRFWGPIKSQTCLADSSPRGLRRPCDLCLPGAPFCGGQGPPAPFRATGLLHRSTLRLARPHGQPSVAAPRCFEFVSTTDVSRHEHPCRNITLGDCRRAPWENPPTFDFQIACWTADALGARESSGDAGPPCGHPASNSFALDGATPASGRSAATLARLARGGGEAPQLCRLAVASPSRTL